MSVPDLGDLLALPVDQIPDEYFELVYEFLIHKYRQGEPVISDSRFDNEFTPEMTRRFPGHPLLNRVESDLPETLSGRRLVKHSIPMLSTLKAYTYEERQAWGVMLIRACEALGIDPNLLAVSVTPKLDGLGCFDDGNTISTRGDGIYGEDITHLFTKLGISPGIPTGAGLGELVVSKSAFDRYFSQNYEHPRSFVVGVKNDKNVGWMDIIGGSDVLRGGDRSILAFKPFSGLDQEKVDLVNFVEEGDKILDSFLESSYDWPLDGVCGVVLVEGDSAATERLRAFLGATEHHYRWQIALKRKGDTAITLVESIEVQIGRTGKLTPLANVSPVSLSGAVIRKIPLFNFSLAKERGIGAGAEIEIVRAGEVIPAWYKTHIPASLVVPEVCPFCEHELLEEGANIFCPNTFGCPARRTESFLYFFKTLDAAYGFGRRTIQKILSSGKVHDLEQFLDLEAEDFLDLGFGSKTSKNLSEELTQLRISPIEDYKLLAALGIKGLGLSLSKRLVRKFPVSEIILGVGIQDLCLVDGIDEPTAKVIGDDTERNWVVYSKLLSKFTIQETDRSVSPISNQALSGQILVFTGAFTSNIRRILEEKAREAGAIVATSVTNRTSFVVYGEKPGSNLTKARQKGVPTMSETEYLEAFFK